MKINWDDVLKLKPCGQTQNKYVGEFPLGNSYQIKTIFKKMLGMNEFVDANWLIVRLMDKTQKIKYAIYAAEQVLGIFEKEYPNDDRPRKAIEAVKKYLKNPSRHSERAVCVSATDAFDAARAAGAFLAAFAIDATDAFDAAHAARAAFAAVEAARSTRSTDAAKKLKTKLINYGLKLLEGK